MSEMHECELHLICGPACIRRSAQCETPTQSRRDVTRESAIADHGYTVLRQSPAIQGQHLSLRIFRELIPSPPLLAHLRPKSTPTLTSSPSLSTHPTTSLARDPKVRPSTFSTHAPHPKSTEQHVRPEPQGLPARQRAAHQPSTSVPPSPPDLFLRRADPRSLTSCSKPRTTSSSRRGALLHSPEDVQWLMTVPTRRPRRSTAVSASSSS